jgi:hypothetical protein
MGAALGREVLSGQFSQKEVAVKRGTLLILLLSTTLIFTGCYKKPDIPGCHWHGDTLYNDYGQQVASVVTPFMQPSQACIFAASGLGYIYGCTYWETEQMAYDHIRDVFAREASESTGTAAPKESR